jgi:hypothetical protein
MNHHIDDDIPPFDDAAHEREWLAQEHAMRRERLHLDPAGDDARGRRYRLLARALRESPGDALPTDFAQRVATRVTAVPVRQTMRDTRFEFVLMIVLAVSLGLAAAMVTTIYGGAWLSPINAILPAADPLTTRWLLAFASCIGLSWLLGQWQRHAVAKPLT